MVVLGGKRQRARHLVHRPLVVFAYSQHMHYTLCVSIGMEVPKMNRIRWQDRIVIAPDIHHGDACIKGTRVPVAVIVGSLADGMKPREIREAYPQLADEDIQAALDMSTTSPAAAQV